MNTREKLIFGGALGWVFLSLLSHAGRYLLSEYQIFRYDLFFVRSLCLVTAFTPYFEGEGYFTVRRLCLVITLIALPHFEIHMWFFAQFISVVALLICLGFYLSISANAIRKSIADG